MGAVRVIGPEDHHVGVLQGVLQQVELLGLAQTPVEAPHMGGAPHPAFPGIRVVQNGGVVDHAEEPAEGGHLVAHDAPVVVGAGDGGDGVAVPLAVRAQRSQTIDLVGDDGGGLVPGNALETGFAPVLLVPVSLGVPVHPLHGVEDAVLRIQTVPLRQDILGDPHGLGGRILLAVPVLYGPGLGIILLGHLERTDAGDLPVLHVYGDRAAGGQIGVHLFQISFTPPDR